MGGVKKKPVGSSAKSKDSANASGTNQAQSQTQKKEDSKKSTGSKQKLSVAIEEAESPDYTGDWSLIQSINAVDVNSDATKEIHLPEGIYSALRTRITSDITGGGSVLTQITSS